MWTRVAELSFLCSKSSWSFRFLVDFKNEIKKNKPVIYFPDYFCNTSLDLIRERDVDINFYPITKDRVPNRLICENKFINKKPDIFIYVHYFGYETKNIDWLISFCQKNGTWLVEDAVHVLKPALNIGQKGDIVLYSPHKLLPIPNGAIIVIKSVGPNNLVNDKNVLNFLIISIQIIKKYIKKMIFLSYNGLLKEYFKF